MYNKIIANNAINKSFLNCNKFRLFSQFENYDIVGEGYFAENPKSFYRKVFDYSLVKENIFQNIELEKLGRINKNEDTKVFRRGTFKRNN